jgi:hypothetical protein
LLALLEVHLILHVSRIRVKYYEGDQINNQMTVECGTNGEKMNCCRDFLVKIQGRKRCKTPSVRGAEIGLCPSLCNIIV